LDWAKATKAAGVVRETVWRWREDPEFETAIQRIMSFGIDDLESVGLNLGKKENTEMIKFFLQAHRRGLYGYKLASCSYLR
jgi:hypothetical protein